MHLSDIIKSDSDRLFIVDTECFIIFTGVSINDDRPFIRIGTWYDLPVEFIPLVENIIVSDRILGNPSYEQFNIDVRYLEANRYIGGESILKRFLEYQRIFGLDLTNVSLVNIEKDIPELSSSKTISGRDQFIGIFYSDGNIKINHGKGNIFDLNSTNRDNMDSVEILDRISANSKNTERYKGSGLVVIDNNPIFYQKGYFTSYQFPDRYFHDFSVLQINPGYIRELLLPSQNLINISGFMKFKNRRGGKIKLYSDNSEQTELIKKLFKNATVADEKFSNLHLSTAEGLKIDSYSSTPNIRLSFRQGDKGGDEITVPFIKSPSDTAKILKEKSDAVLITYTAYEESALLFKSTETPVIIIDDGNPNISKLYGSDRIILKPGIQYDLKKYRLPEDLLNEFTGLDALKQAIDSSDRNMINDQIDSIISNSNSIESMNITGLIKAYMGITTDRKKYSMLKEILQDIRGRTTFSPDTALRSSVKMVLALHNNFCCTLLKQIAEEQPERFIDEYSETTVDGDMLNAEQRLLGLRILEDRKRLARLLSIFYKEKSGTPAFSEIEKEMSLLKNEISTRKDIYNNEFYSIAASASCAAKGGIGRWRDRILKPGAADTGTQTNPLRAVLSNRKLLIPAALIVSAIIIVLLLMIYSHKKSIGSSTPVLSESELKPVVNRNIVLTGEGKQVITVKRVDSQEKQLLIKHKVTITESDIYRYSNDVAVKNGYSKISYNGLKNKNPHWIYPDNIFIMLDGEKVVVQKGDTLWDLAHAKLEKMNADFYKIIDEIEKNGFSDKKRIQGLIVEAERFSYLKKQSEVVESYKKRLQNE